MHLPAILGGDFAQILPVVKNGNRASIVNACLQKSTLWSRLQKLILRQNMRLQGERINAEFAQWLSQLSHDPALSGSILLPALIPQKRELADLYERVFPQGELQSAHENPNSFRSRAILTRFNEVVIEINAELLDCMQGETRVLLGEDSAEVEDDTLPEYSVESLQDIRLAGLPLSELS